MFFMLSREAATGLHPSTRRSSTEALTVHNLPPLRGSESNTYPTWDYRPRLLHVAASRLAFARMFRGVGGVVVGMDSKPQL